ncbi:hypothetical protein CAOG_07533 [Capsaspora owczarzaki ATCC 30864]|uniref:Transcription initiation factor IIA subunit 2 n=1 Tax=Capsaspora owczarzaki (strain ATCC 30864) TaxID=595528 RepID=A0A0D2X521_CAPO3|nr:hypothetical protein CAOG_07533 [Capsaspora owczarzaki ATCC 30864]KJE97049.1 hypothetical protein CAOG_007533 [Capsaspora owczarzaki ATCC 30864]|eukprot:XP_004343407.2 hypothetical protein CAOG_07533 [Capsaspora owczarzaki ATCC 30864]
MTELFRETVLGKALIDILNEMVHAGALQSKLALEVLEHFDQVVEHTLNTEVRSKINFKAHLETYRYVEGLWFFHLKDFSQFRIDNENITDPGDVQILAYAKPDLS